MYFSPHPNLGAPSNQNPKLRKFVLEKHPGVCVAGGRWGSQTLQLEAEGQDLIDRWAPLPAAPVRRGVAGEEAPSPGPTDTVQSAPSVTARARKPTASVHSALFIPWPPSPALHLTPECSADQNIPLRVTQRWRGVALSRGPLCPRG